MRRFEQLNLINSMAYVFNRMAALERKVGASCLKDTTGDKTTALFLDELALDRGDFPTEIIPECGLFCPLEFL